MPGRGRRRSRAGWWPRTRGTPVRSSGRRSRMSSSRRLSWRSVSSASAASRSPARDTLRSYSGPKCSRRSSDRLRRESLTANAATTTSRTATTTTKMITVGSIGHLLGPSATSLWCCPSLSILQMTPRDLADDARHSRPVRPPTAAPEPGAAATTLAGTGIEPSNRPLAQITSSTTVRLVRRARRPRLLRRQFRVVPGTAYGRARVGWSTQVGKGLIGSG